jgi:hypothetical protein
MDPYVCGVGDGERKRKEDKREVKEVRRMAREKTGQVRREGKR